MNLWHYRIHVVDLKQGCSYFISLNLKGFYSHLISHINLYRPIILKYTTLQSSLLFSALILSIPFSITILVIAAHIPMRSGSCYHCYHHYQHYLRFCCYYYYQYQSCLLISNTYHQHHSILVILLNTVTITNCQMKKITILLRNIEKHKTSVIFWKQSLFQFILVKCSVFRNVWNSINPMKQDSQLGILFTIQWRVLQCYNQLLIGNTCSIFFVRILCYHTI